MKMTKFNFLVALCLIPAGIRLSYAEETGGTAQARRTYAHGELPKFISVVQTTKPPSIDGIMEKDEWASATAVTGLTKTAYIGQNGVHGCSCDDPENPRGSRDPSFVMIDNMANHQSTFWLTYDDENLYIAHHSPPPPNIKDMPAMIEVMLKKTQTLHDSNINYDDCINIEIMSPVYPGGDNYVIQITSAGTTFECIWGGNKGNLPGITISWDPPIKTASRLSLEGWVIETAIPWSGLEPHIRKPQAGEVLYMNFGRLWKEVMDEDHAWQGYDGFRPKGEVAFMGTEGITVQLKDAGNLPRGEAVFAADITNFYATERKLVAEVATDSGELKDTQEITIAPGKTVPYSFEGKITDFATTVISLTISDMATKNIIHATTLPVIRPTEPAFFIRRYRSMDLVKIETDMSFFGAADLARTSIGMVVRNGRNGRQVLKKTYRDLNSYQPVLAFSTEGWEPGDYEVHFTFSATRMKKHQAVLNYRHPPLPEWWGNRHGFEDMDHDMVPYPWTDMEMEADTMKVWGRSYHFGDSLLPEQITTLDHAILRAPMRIIVRTTDGEVLDTAAGVVEGEWSKTDRTRVEGSRRIEDNDLSLNNSFWAEYDGLLWNTLTLHAAADTEITWMELEIPLTKEFSDVINALDYSLRTSGKLKPEGHVGPATRPIWLGNGEGGMQLISNEDNLFFVQDIRKVIQVETSADGATLRLIMVDTPTKFDAPYEIQFGLIATPVRPKITRTPYFTESGIKGGGAWYPEGLEFVAAADPGFDFYGYGSKAGRIYVHPAPLNVSPEAMAKDAAGAEDYLFADEFRENPADRTLTRIKTDFRTQTSRDYYVYRHWLYQQKYGFKGLYYDGVGGVTLGLREIMKRLYNITLSNPHFSGRETNVGIHSSAMFNMAALAFGSYNWDAENYNSIINANQQTYRGVTDPAMYRAQHMGHNLGWPLFFLGQGRIKREWVEANGGPEAVFDQISGLDLLHDGGGVCCIMPAVQGAKSQEMRRVRERMANALEKHNFHHWTYQFTPYWQQDITKLPDQNMHASFYIAQPSKLTATSPTEHQHRGRVFSDYFAIHKHLPRFMQAVIPAEIEKERKYLQYLKDKAIIIVYNNTDWEGEMRLEMDWPKLGLGTPETLTAENAVHSTGFRLEKKEDAQGQQYEEAVFFPRAEEYAIIEGDELVFPMTKYNYRMLVIEKK